MQNIYEGLSHSVHHTAKKNTSGILNLYYSPCMLNLESFYF